MKPSIGCLLLGAALQEAAAADNCTSKPTTHVTVFATVTETGSHTENGQSSLSVLSAQNGTTLAVQFTGNLTNPFAVATITKTAGVNLSSTAATSTCTVGEFSPALHSTISVVQAPNTTTHNVMGSAISAVGTKVSTQETLTASTTLGTVGKTAVSSMRGIKISSTMTLTSLFTSTTTLTLSTSLVSLVATSTNEQLGSSTDQASHVTAMPVLTVADVPQHASAVPADASSSTASLLKTVNGSSTVVSAAMSSMLTGSSTIVVTVTRCPDTSTTLAANSTVGSNSVGVLATAMSTRSTVTLPSYRPKPFPTTMLSPTSTSLSSTGSRPVLPYPFTLISSVLTFFVDATQTVTGAVSCPRYFDCTDVTTHESTTSSTASSSPMTTSVARQQETETPSIIDFLIAKTKAFFSSSKSDTAFEYSIAHTSPSFHASYGFGFSTGVTRGCTPATSNLQNREVQPITNGTSSTSTQHESMDFNTADFESWKGTTSNAVSSVATTAHVDGNVTVSMATTGRVMRITSTTVQVTVPSQSPGQPVSTTYTVVQTQSITYDLTFKSIITTAAVVNGNGSTPASSSSSSLPTRFNSTGVETVLTPDPYSFYMPPSMSMERTITATPTTTITALATHNANTTYHATTSSMLSNAANVILRPFYTNYWPFFVLLFIILWVFVFDI